MVDIIIKFDILPKYFKVINNLLSYKILLKKQ